jgi:acetoin utilization protein AcuC
MDASERPRAAIVHTPAAGDYHLGPGHPLDPVRVELALDLVRACGLLTPAGPVDLLRPETLDEEDLLLVHDAAYVETVKAASAAPESFEPRMGLGTGDNPVAVGIHETSLAICSCAAGAVAMVLDGREDRTFAISGGLHHAHRARAAGFCVYNDPAVAIAMALREHPDLRIMYLDIDAHHGDGVQEAFYDEPRVLTVSLHESGRFLFPGTGMPEESGGPGAPGSAVNVPMPPLADGTCYQSVFEAVVEPVARAWRPDLLVAQCGCDAHHADPLTHLGLTIDDFGELYRRIVALAEEHCAGKLTALGGGGYGLYSTVPRAWTLLTCVLAGIDPPNGLPEAWRRESATLSGAEAPRTLTTDRFELSPERRALVQEQTAEAIAALAGRGIPGLA